jgi:glycosyltransferase involved in cell wall biosynthesis
MKLMPKVSVVIPTHNYANFVSEAIESALGQTLRPHEVIVVNDGSTDETPQVLAEFSEPVRAVHLQNRGVCAARNEGATLATGDLLAFLDADDIWLPTKLEKQAQRFLDDPEIGLVHCGVQHVNLAGHAVRTLLDGMEGWVAIDLLLARRNVILGGGSGMMVSRAAFEVVGGFDTRLTHAEDWDLWYRLASRYKVGFVPEVLLHYRLHDRNTVPYRIPTSSWCKQTERDIMVAYQKAFTNTDPSLRQLRRRVYGNLHMALAGFYFAARQPRDVVRHVLRSIWLTPDNIIRLLIYPLRSLRRRFYNRYLHLKAS